MPIKSIARKKREHFVKEKVWHSSVPRLSSVAGVVLTEMRKKQPSSFTDTDNVEATLPFFTESGVDPLLATLNDVNFENSPLAPFIAPWINDTEASATVRELTEVLDKTTAPLLLEPPPALTPLEREALADAQWVLSQQKQGLLSNYARKHIAVFDKHVFEGESYSAALAKAKHAYPTVPEYRFYLDFIF